MNKINSNLIKKCGVYMIINNINNYRYIGSSVNLYNKLHSHIHLLENNKAHNKTLQKHWNKYKKESFSYEILEFCNKDNKLEKEQYYIINLKPEFNLSLNVVANIGRIVSKETRELISNKLKDKYKNGEIECYKQSHNWKKNIYI